MFWDYGRPSGRWEIWVSAADIISSYLFKRLFIYFSGRAGYGASLEGMVSIDYT